MDEKYDPEAIESKWQAYRNKTLPYKLMIFD